MKVIVRLWEDHNIHMFYMGVYDMWYFKELSMICAYEFMLQMF